MSRHDVGSAITHRPMTVKSMVERFVSVNPAPYYTISPGLTLSPCPLLRDWTDYGKTSTQNPESRLRRADNAPKLSPRITLLVHRFHIGPGDAVLVLPSFPVRVEDITSSVSCYHSLSNLTTTLTIAHAFRSLARLASRRNQSRAGSQERSATPRIQEGSPAPWHPHRLGFRGSGG